LARYDNRDECEIAELARLQVSDFDSRRMVIHLRGGKGRQDRDRLPFCNCSQGWEDLRDGLVHNHSWLELKDCRVEESRAVQVSLSHIWEDVDRRLNQLKEAQGMVIEDPGILRGMPVFKGTRIPVHDVVSLVDSGTPMEEILEIYPRLKKPQVELASIYARANPRRGRPKRRSFPKGIKVSISRKRLRDASLGR